MNNLIIKGLDLKPIVITTCDDSEILENQENLFYGNSFDIFSIGLINIVKTIILI
jgi:hypothetical protein